MLNSQEIELDVPFQMELLPVLTGSVEQSLQAFGLGRAETLHLTLAVEEMYSFLAPQTQSGQRMRLTCSYRGYYAEVVCRFRQHALPMEVFNITSSVAADDEKSLAEMGLLLAARTVDQLRINAEDNGMNVHFIKEKRYPENLGTQEDSTQFQTVFQNREMDSELLKQFAKRVTGKYGSMAPSFFHYPGKVVDMVESGDYGVILLTDNRRNVGGGIIWRQGSKLAEAFGPFVFCQASRLPEQIVENFMSKLARTSQVCIVIKKPTPELPDGYFEALADNQTAVYRQLEEDNGAVAYIHPGLAEFLRNGYRKLFLPRQIHEVTYEGEALQPCSAFSTQLDPGRKQARLTSLWVGADAVQTLQDHIRALRMEGFDEISFHLDLAEPEQAGLGPALLETGFVPQWILPWGGRGDLLVLTHLGSGKQ